MAVAAVAGVAVPLIPVPAPQAASTATPPVVFTFDDLAANSSGSPAAGPVADQLLSRGVRFTTTATPLRFDARSIPTGPLARSAPVAVAICYSRELCTDRFDMDLTVPAAAVTAWVGTYNALQSAATITMVGFDAQGKELSRDSLQLGPGAAPVAVGKELSVATGSSPLARVTLGGSPWLLLDDLTITPYLAPAHLEFKPTTVALDTERGHPTPTTVQLANSGGAAVNLASVAIEVGDTRSWTVERSACPLSLPGGASCDIVVSFTGPSIGAFTARLVARSSSEDSATVSLTATVHEPTTTTQEPTTTTTTTTTTQPTTTDTTEPTTTTAATDTTRSTTTIAPGTTGSSTSSTATSSTAASPTTTTTGIVGNGTAVGGGTGPAGPTIPPPTKRTGGIWRTLVRLAAMALGSLVLVAGGRRLIRRPAGQPSGPNPAGAPVPALRIHPGDGRGGFRPGAGPVIAVAARLPAGASRLTFIGNEEL